jgi:ferric-dicitrate binding protein FerR (iron transport regulator)
MSDDRRTPSQELGATELSPAEREALQAWSAAEPPAGLAAQVLARAASESRPATRRRLSVAGIAAGVALVAAALGFGLLRPWRGPSSGEHLTTSRATLDLGGRATVVAEPSTELSWRVARDGAARVQQRSGNAFYRVERGGEFVVETPRGTIRVLGTCFRVEVIEMKPSRAGVIGAGVGAALATVVLVSVYEGRVLTASPVGRKEVSAGEAGRLEERGAPRAVSEAEARATRAGVIATPPGASLGPAELRERNEQLAIEAQRLRDQVKSLQAKVQQLGGEASKQKTFDLTKEELAGLASRCELRWDNPSMESEAPKASGKAVKDLGLNATERAAVEKALLESHQQLVKQLRQLYVEATGDKKGADSLSPESLTREIADKSSRDDLKVVFQRLARERAGQQAPPADLASTSAVERMYRLLTTNGDRLEQAIGAQIGPDLARRYRELGFGGRWRSSYGCP